jgi:hypothetical protein
MNKSSHPQRTSTFQFFERHYLPQKSRKVPLLIKRLKHEKPGKRPKRSAKLYSELARFERGLQTPEFLEHQLNSLLSLANFQPSDSVASIGSGIGLTETFIAKNILHNGKMICLDFAHGASKEAKKIKAKENATNMSIITASGTNLPLRPGTQDFVISIQNNTPNTSVWGGVLEETRRVLKPTQRARLIFTILPEEKNKEREISHACADLEKHGFAVEKMVHYLDINKYYGVIIVARPLTIFG